MQANQSTALCAVFALLDIKVGVAGVKIVCAGTTIAR